MDECKPLYAGSMFLVFPGNWIRGGGAYTCRTKLVLAIGGVKLS